MIKTQKIAKFQKLLGKEVNQKKKISIREKWQKKTCDFSDKEIIIF